MSNIINLPPNSKSGLYKGKLHTEGGIQSIVDGVRKVEIEKDEYHICKTVMAHNKQYEFKNKTNKEILQAIFQDNHCVFEQGKSSSNDFIICRPVVLDDKRRDMNGSAKDIINVLQSEKNCRVTADAADTYSNRLGGQLADKDTRLIGVHNLWFEHLIFADEMGGLPMPSLAIINPNIPFVKYGEITLVAPKDLYDPKESAKNKLYNRDIYSPRFPTVYMKIDRKKLEANFSKYIIPYGEDTEFLKNIEDNQVRKLVYEGFRYVYDKIEQGKETVRKVISDVEYNNRFMLAFANVKGINVPIEYKYKPLQVILSTEPQKKAIDFLKKLIDKKYPELKEIKHYQHDDEKATKLITDFYVETHSDKSMLRMKYANGKKSIDDIIVDLGKEIIENNLKDGKIFYATGVEIITEIKSLYESEKIINESKLGDYFEESKFSNKHSAEIQEFVYELSNNAVVGHYFIQSVSGRKVPMTLENVERYMKSQGLKNAEGFSYRLGNASALASKEYKSLSAAKSDFDKVISDKDFQKFLANQTELIDKADQARGYYKYQDSSHSFYNALGKVGQYNEPTDEQIQRIFRGEDFNDLPTEIINNVHEAAMSVRNSPTEYFEVKLKKSVRLNEFVGAIVPEEFKEAIDILKKHGMKNIETYKYDEKDREKRIKNRIKALNEIVNKMKDDVTFEEGGSVSDTETESKPSTVGVISSDFSTLMFADKKGGFYYPTVHFINIENDYDSKLIPKPLVLVLHNVNANTPDYIEVREIKYAIIPESMDEAKAILNKYKVPFVTYELNSGSDNKEAKLNALKSIVK